MQIAYRFIFGNGHEESFAMSFDPETMAYQPEAGAAPPDWAKLDNHKCRNCPLKAADEPHCPVARNLAPVLTRFIDRLSYEEADVVVVTDAREYRKRVPLQRGVAAIFGLIMATSGCPVLDKMRPMAFTHLPLSEMAETRYRAVAMYLFAQFFRERKGLPVDRDLKGLEEIYANIGILNQDFIARLRTIDMQDANFNALINLDCFRLGSQELMTRALDRMEKIFQSYLR